MPLKVFVTIISCQVPFKLVCWTSNITRRLDCYFSFDAIFYVVLLRQSQIAKEKEKYIVLSASFKLAFVMEICKV